MDKFMSDKLVNFANDPYTSQMVDYYGANYNHLITPVYQEIRRETFDEDIHQTGWLTTKELQQFINWLDLKPDASILDVGSGAGGPTIRVAQMTGCRALGIDIHERAVTAAKATADTYGLSERVHFEQVDASQQLPYPDAAFDAVICIDAVNHLPNREVMLADWARVLKPGGKILFTDPVVITGPLSKNEIAIRSSIGYFLFVPEGVDIKFLKAAGLEILVSEDVTANMAMVAEHLYAARAARANALRQLEGDVTYEGQQEFLRVTALIAKEHRLSRFVYVARKPTP